MPPRKPVPVLYCDIDDTIRHGKDTLGRFVNTKQDVTVFDGVKQLLWRYRALGWRIIGISNQGGIALGHLSATDCFDAMEETNRQVNFAFENILWCEHHPDAENPRQRSCWCRKPSMGMLVRATTLMAEKYTSETYPPNMALLVGDREEDQLCAQSARVAFMWADAWRESVPLDKVTHDPS